MTETNIMTVEQLLLKLRGLRLDLPVYLAGAAGTGLPLRQVHYAGTVRGPGLLLSDLGEGLASQATVVLTAAS